MIRFFLFSKINFKSIYLISILLLLTLCASSCNQDSQSLFKKNTLTLFIVHNPQLAAYMQHVTELFKKTPSAVLADGSKIEINLISDNSLSASRRIGSGRLKVHGWLAPSTALVNYTNANLNNLGPKQTDCTQLFASPIVVATSKKNLAKFNSKDQVFSWKTLFPDPLKDKNPNTQKLLFNHSSPFASASGLASLIQLSYIALESPSIIRQEELAAPSILSKLEQYERNATGYGYSDATLLNQVAWARNDKVHFTITSEQELAKFNQSRIKSGLDPLLALYPQEGSYWIDYNMCLSEADWLSPAHRKAMEVFTNFLTLESSQMAAEAVGFRPSAGAVPLIPPLTSEYGINVSLGKTALLPVSGETIGFLLQKWPELLKPAAVLFVMDTSGSMEGPSIRVGKTSFRNTIAATTFRDKKALMSFATTPKLESDFSTEGGQIIQTLDKLQPQGGSAVYDAILKASHYIQNDSLKDFRKSIIIFTDGGDKNSDVPLKRLLENVKDIFNRNNINLVIIAIGHDEDVTDLSAIANAANGVFIQTSYDEVGVVFERIRSLL